MKEIILCPYHANFNNTCSNKYCKFKKTSKGSTICIYKNPLKCPMYIERIVNKKKSKIEASKRLRDIWEKEDD